MYPSTGELLGYFLVAVGLFCRQKHVSIEIIGSRGIYCKHFQRCQTKILCGNFKGKMFQTAIITEPITLKQ